MTQTPIHLRNREYVYDVDPVLEPAAEYTTPAPAQQHIAPSAAQERPRSVASPMPYVAPIDRRHVDALRPSFYLLLAGAFFALSVFSTVAQVGRILELGGLSLVGWQMVTAGLLVASIITAGELMTGEGLIYFCFLIPDCALTIWWLWPVLKNWSEALGAGQWGAAIGGMALGILSAWIPERVVLGARRRQR
ncbi:MAG: hypothetical protein H0T53_14165 [Herpetosiphonaceae bacterium]|nr:hypothetical protein [Herpetosiphonaceae bacterium]